MSTGQKDINNNEVLEGDIVEFNPIGSTEILSGKVVKYDGEWRIQVEPAGPRGIREFYRLDDDVFGKVKVVNKEN